MWAIGQWAAEWVFGDPSTEDCEGLLLLWRMHQHAVSTPLPAQRTIVHVMLTGPGAAEGWLDVERRGITVCRDDPGRDVDLAVEADTAAMQWWLLGVVPFHELVVSGCARLLGPTRLTRAFPTLVRHVLLRGGPPAGTAATAA